MKKGLYMALTLISTLTISGCSAAVTEDELATIQEAENSDTELDSSKAITEKSIDLGNDLQHISGSEIAEFKEKTADLFSEEAMDYTIELEGMEEIVQVKTHHSTLGYQMLYDINRFSIENNDETDLFLTENPDSNIYPDVYIKFKKTDKASNTDFVEQTKQKLLKEEANTEQFENVKIGEYEAIQFKLKSGEEWNSIVKNIYIIETDMFYYTIETQFFVEAEEGYGARISALLDTFIIL